VKDKMKLFYMDMARRAAQLSHAERLKVGAVARTPQDVVIYSWNGRPSGDDNDCEIKTYDTHSDTYTLVTHPDVLHAESNLVAKAAREGVSLKGSDIFVTDSPCLMCAKQMFQAGVSSVTYEREYRLTDGVEFLNLHGIPCTKEFYHDGVYVPW
jgi:dCMP deaminase